MAWYPPQLDLASLGYEGLNRLMNGMYRRTTSSPINAPDHLNSRLGICHYGDLMPIPRVGKVGKCSTNASKLSICARLERAKWEP